MRREHRFWVAVAVTCLLGIMSVVMNYIPIVAPDSSKLINTDVLVYGATLGGSAAAIAAAKDGVSVTLISDSPSIGGQAVESGMGAFDDDQRSWENFGMYADLKKFLQEKYSSSSNKHFGLGEASVGEVATLPSDIEEFFLKKIGENNIYLIKDFVLTGLKKEGITYSEATLRNNKNIHETIRVRFKYLLDGTQLGNVFGKIGSGFTIGYDTLEETGEESALPKDVRSKIIEGYEMNGKKIVGLGNRVQAISSPFALLDKGYAGDFYPVTDYDRNCWAPSPTPPYVRKASVLTAQRNDCTATIEIKTEFSDTYDLFFINHGNSSVELSYSTQYPNTSPIQLKEMLDTSKDAEMVIIGTYFIDNRSPAKISISAQKQGFALEGIILSKRNLPQPPIILQVPLKNGGAFSNDGLPRVSTDCYFTTKSKLPSDSFSFAMNDQGYEANRIGTNTYRAENIPIRKDNTLWIDPLISDQLSQATIIPVASDTQMEQVLLSSFGSDVDTSPLVNNPLWKSASYIKEWVFTPKYDGEYVTLLQWQNPKWTSFELSDMTDGHTLTSFTFKHKNYVRDDFHPLFIQPLSAGKQYRIRFGLLEGKNWTPFSFAITPLSQTNYIFNKGDSPNLPVGSISYSGIYDVWVRAVRSNAKPELEVDSPRTRKFITVPNGKIFAYAGKFYLHNTDEIGAHPAKVGEEILIIPNTTVNTYIHNTANSDDSLQFDRLPTGMLWALVEKRKLLNANSFEITDARDQVEQRIPLTDINATYSAQIPFSSVGSPLTFRLSSGSFPADSKMVFYEQLPDSDFLRWRFETMLPLFHPIHSQPSTSQFSFRNIVSGNNLLTRTIPNLPSDNIGDNTLGISLIVDPSNDYAPIKAEDISSLENTEKSRLLSYAYYYWLKYDLPPTQRNLGCEQSEPLCDSRRIQLAIGLFPNKRSIFPPKPYQREARRISAVTTITERDIALEHTACPSRSCTNSGCISALSQNSCTFTAQSPILFPDAIGATHYLLDIHSFFSRPEQDSDLPKLLDTMVSDKILTERPVLFSQNRYIWSKPSEVRLGSVIPRSILNILPASTTIGVTQIAQGAYRTHVNELVIGQSVGHLAAYCVTRSNTPFAIVNNREQLKQFQHFLVDKGMHIYPIDDLQDPLLYTSAQHRIIDGTLTLQTNFDPQSMTVHYVVGK